MNDPPRGPGHLRPVREDTTAATAPAEPDTSFGNGLTPPTRRGGPSRFIADVIVELGYVDRERMDAAVEESRNVGRAAGQVLLESGAITRISWPARSPSASGSITRTSASTPPTWARPT